MSWFQRNWLTKRRHHPSPLESITVEVFERAAISEGFTIDEAQREAIGALMASAEHGFYLWGPVGCGKSWILNVYYEAISSSRKRRVHFHEFFHQLHQAITKKGNSIERALDELLNEVDVLCFDEFHVHDVGDSTFIRRMLLELFARPIRLIVTSNYPPDGLLPNPLFHDMFLPTIEVIAEKLEVLEIRGTRDYRLDSEHTQGFSSGVWLSPGTAAQYRELGLSTHGASSAATVTVSGRLLNVVQADHELLWFRFSDLCESKTGSSDYLDLAARHQTWLISDIPSLTELDREPAQRFANLIDVLYDRQILVTFIATAPIHELAATSRGPLDIDRTISRLSQLRHHNESILK
ncbi:cell division protein ZapE [Arthrobacter glacialis]|uniref:Cell division protein ZapE n=1 Tax=Arthrobacter glacialis TaxID=1664 RepID=A0A2S3ZR28_ARTGL|nr:cell division protein ZapE [Arthrobacter glacialis]POH71660.1 cell division protein ZapE [Arthrobacter glacialis]